MFSMKLLKNLNLLGLLLFLSMPALAITISPAPNNGNISLVSGIQTLTLTNDSQSPVQLNLSLSSASGLSKVIDRCSSRLLRAKGSCYIMISVSSSAPSFSSDLKNDSTTLATLQFSSPFVSSKSISLSTSSLNFGTVSNLGNSAAKEIKITNTGNTSLNPEIQLSPNMKMLINRCSSLKKNSSCSIYVSLNANPSLGNSGPLVGESISIKPSSTDSAEVVSVSANLNISSSCLSNEHLSSGNVCESNTQTCSLVSSGIKSGTKTWNAMSSSFGSCLPLSQADCFSGYTYSSGSCTLLSPSVLATEYLPDESLLANPSYYMFYTNQASFARLFIKFTLTQKSYVNSFDIKMASNPSVFMGFYVYSFSDTSSQIDGRFGIRQFDTYVTSAVSGIKTVSMSGAGLLLEAGDYYISDMLGYFGGSYNMPLYYSPPNVSSTIYGQEANFGYSSGFTYGGGVYIPFNIAPNNFAPYFKIHTTPFVP